MCEPVLGEDLVNAAQWLIAAIMALIATATFLLMRYPRFRRTQFRESGAFSFRVSLVTSVLVAVLGALMVWVQGVTGRPVP